MTKKKKRKTRRAETAAFSISLSRKNDLANGKLPSVHCQNSRAPSKAMTSQSLQSHLKKAWDLGL